jgi:hypothetical protein
MLNGRLGIDLCTFLHNVEIRRCWPIEWTLVTFTSISFIWQCSYYSKSLLLLVFR